MSQIGGHAARDIGAKAGERAAWCATQLREQRLELRGSQEVDPVLIGRRGGFPLDRPVLPHHRRQLDAIERLPMFRIIRRLADRQCCS